MPPILSVFSTRSAAPGSSARLWWLSRYTLFSMLFGTLPLVLLPQGRDLVVALAEKGTPVEQRGFFYFALALWGLSVWYWSRVLLDVEYSETSHEYGGLARHLPRIFGGITMLLPAIPIALASSETLDKIAMVSGCVGLAIAFWIFVINRRKLKIAQGPAVTAFSIGAVTGRPAGVIAIASFAASLSVFVFFVFYPLAAGRHLGAVAILFIAAANIVFFGNVTVFASQLCGIRLDLVALVAATFFSLRNDNHNVQVERLKTPLPALEKQFGDWRQQVPSNRSGPVFLVAAEGGGIRAAFWTATVLGGLSDKSQTHALGSRLFAVSGISGGTLGAAVYAALRHDLRENAGDLKAKGQRVLSHDLLSPIVAKLVTGDFLQWFLPFAVPAFDRSTAIEDAFRQAYVSGTDGATGKDGTLGEPITTLWPDAQYGVPALVMNITVVDTGGRAIIAPFTWSQTQIPEGLMYTCWVTQDTAAPPIARDCQNQTDYAAPRLANAIHNGARFTYVSPAGRVRSVTNRADLGHVVDGGYFDPTGVDTLLDLAAALHGIDRTLEIVPIFITNATVPDDVNDAALRALQGEAPSSGAKTAAVDTDAKPMESPSDAKVAAPVQLLGEVFAPVRALVRSRGAHGRLAVERERLYPAAVTFGFCRVAGTPEERRAEPPLGWQLSKAMQTRLDQYWETCQANAKGMRIVESLLNRPH